MNVHYGYQPHLSVYSASSIHAALKLIKDLCPVFKNITKTNSAQLQDDFPNIPIGFAIALPKRSCIDFNMKSILESPDHIVTIEPWTTIHKHMKLNNKIVWSYNNKTNWINVEDIISQPGEEYYIVKRIKDSKIITKYSGTPYKYNRAIVRNTVNDADIINTNSSVFLFTFPDTYSLQLGIAQKNQIISYSNKDTNLKVLQNICEATYVALTSNSFLAYKGNCELHYTDNTVYVYDKNEISSKMLIITNIYELMNLYISFPVKFSTILENDNNAILHIDPLNSNNFLYKVPKVNNSFHFTHSSLPLSNNIIRPPFLLQMRNSYNNNNMELNGKLLTCLAILQEKKDSNILSIIETYQTKFFPSPNQYLQFVITDNKNNIIHIHPSSLIMISLFFNVT